MILILLDVFIPKLVHPGSVALRKRATCRGERPAFLYHHSCCISAAGVHNEIEFPQASCEHALV